MEHVTEWALRLHLFEHDDRTTARTVLDTGSIAAPAEGVARRNPHDIAVPEIGDELAAGRTLAKLPLQLLRTAESDVEALGERR